MMWSYQMDYIKAEQEAGMGKKQELSPAEQLTNFLNFIDTCERVYLVACDEMNSEEKRLQDFLHEIELAPNAAEINKAAARLQKSRKRRRENKDTALLYKQIVEFFQEKGHRETLNRMRQLLGRQRKEEDYLQRNRIYHPRMTESPKA